MSDPHEQSGIWLSDFAGRADICRELTAALHDAGIEVRSGGPHAEERTGVVLFDQCGDDLQAKIRELSHEGRDRVLALRISANEPSDGAAWRLLDRGASDVLTWHRDANLAARVRARLERWLAVERLVDSALTRENLAGSSPAWRSVLRQIVEAAHFTDASVLITGPNGTGKEQVARLIHRLDRRPQKGDLVLCDGTTVSPELSGSEFFGHERGAFTGADVARDGLFALADGGTVFLDEVGELPLKLQAELLRVAQEQTYRRVGSHTWKQANFRLICATNRDLEQDIERGSFRRDLYHRLATWRFHLPALEQRRDDIIPLTKHFLRQHFNTDSPPQLDPPVRDYLLIRKYPGNIRELKQLVTRLAQRHVGPGPITVGSLPEEEIAANNVFMDSTPDAAFEASIRNALARGKGLNEIRDTATDTAYRIVLADEDSDTGQASRRLKVSQRTVQQYLQVKKPR